MHSIPLEMARDFGLKGELSEYWWSHENMTQIIERIRAKVYFLLTKKEIDWIEHQFRVYFQLSSEFSLTVIHSDFTRDHLLFDIDQNRVAGIIDFSDTELSDPAMDFAGLWYYDEELPSKVLNYYEFETSNGFLERSKFPRLMHMVSNMLEIIEGHEIPVTIEQCKEKLREVMQSGLTL